MSTPIERACAAAGGQTKLAEALGITVGAVNHWVSGRGVVPAERCPAIERAVLGAVTRAELRPDVFEEAAV